MRKVAILSVCLVIATMTLPAVALAGGRSPGHGGFRGHAGHRSGPVLKSPGGHAGFRGGPGIKSSGGFRGGPGFHGGFRGGGAFPGPKGHHGGVFTPRRFDPGFHGKFHHPFPRHSTSFFFFSAPFWYWPPALVSPPPVVYSAPTVYTAPTVYVSQPAYPSQAPVAAEPMPRVVEYATGRYELRGDGIATPYVWVWIPSPPTAPPAGEPEGSEAPPETSEPPANSSKIYRWTDDEGTTFWTDSPDKIPEAHRSRLVEPVNGADDPS
jgi:hypothetical protein